MRSKMIMVRRSFIFPSNHKEQRRSLTGQSPSVFLCRESSINIQIDVIFYYSWRLAWASRGQILVPGVHAILQENNGKCIISNRILSKGANYSAYIRWFTQNYNGVEWPWPIVLWQFGLWYFHNVTVRLREWVSVFLNVTKVDKSDLKLFGILA